MTTKVSSPGLLAFAALLAWPVMGQAQASQTPDGSRVYRQMERLNRGAVAAPALAGGNLISWRLLADDPAAVAFDVYGVAGKLNTSPIVDSTTFVDVAGQAGASYSVRVAGASEAEAGAQAVALATGYISVPLQQPPGGVNPDGQAFTYTANDASVGDLDGDGRHEIVLKWDPTTSKDNAFGGYSGSTILDAYTLEGQRLWRIDMGRNIRAGAHYTQFLVFDFDGDGRAEVVAKTADGTVDGLGKVIGDADADWRGSGGEVPQADRTGAVLLADGTKVAPLTGRILKGPEFLTVFDGRTGAALDTEPYSPGRHPNTQEPTFEQMTEVWGDGYANRSDRYLAGVAYLDGIRPSVVMGRGYYGRSTLAAWDFREGKLTQRWLFDSAVPGNEAFSGQGNHQLEVADVDGDGRDEIVYGSMAVDDDGTGLWSARLFHGDAMHLTDLDPDRPGLEKFGVHESPRANGGIGSAMLDARTGEVLWSTPTETDTGRGSAFDIDPTHRGAEAWATNSSLLYDVHGQVISQTRPRQVNFGVWWDGDLLRELLDGNTIYKWNWTTSDSEPLMTATGATSNNGTKATPVLSADILGDWREEVVLRSEDNSALRIYVTPYTTGVRLVTLMQDPVYRLGVAWQNTAYNQPPHVSYFLGEGMAPRPTRR